VHQVLRKQALASNQIGPVTVSCPAGELVLSGGWATSPSVGSYPIVFKSSRNGNGSWSIFVDHTGTTVVTAYALCLKNAAGATVTERAATVQLVDSELNGTHVTCNRGEIVVGGGFSGSKGIKFEALAGSSYWNRWRGGVYNHSGAVQPFTVFAECLRYAGASINPVTDISPVGASISEACPKGSYVSGGGFMAMQFVTFALIVVSSPTASGQQWMVSEASGAKVSAQVICLTL
jgi:hypothetical protein